MGIREEDDMATDRKTTSKTPLKTTSKKSAAKKTTKPAIEKRPIAGKHGQIEEAVRIKLEGGMALDVKISIGSTPKVGPGPKPKRGELLLVSRISDTQVMTISAELKMMERAAINIGPGQRPGTGGN